MIGLAMKRHVLAGFLAVFVGVGTGIQAATPEDKFHEGYYLETARGDFAAAAEAYGAVVSDRAADATLRAKAQARLDGVREELACSDFAKLMPPTTLAYLEINQPGDQVIRLVEQLGLLADEDQPPDSTGKRVAISPALIREILGIRGAAVAVTAFDPVQQKPAGVVVFHPGDMGIVRGLIETGLPIGSRIVEPIGGFPTYDVEGEALVTLTSRLVVASPQRAQIEGVLRRLSGQDQTSLLTNNDLTDALKGRDDSLLFFCINAKPILPMLNGMLAAGAMQSRELAVARAVLDINSLRSLVGRAGVGDDGMFFDVSLRLDEGHHNLVYNLLRTPPIDRETLKNIPSGAAGFLAGALNESPSRYTAANPSPTGTPPVVTALDFGRELFANITSMAIYALPPEGDGGQAGASPIPDLAAAISVNDPAKSEALWTQVLGIASIASGARTIEGIPATIEGVQARSYQLPENISIHFATHGNDILISTTREAMARSIRAKRNGDSILKDPAFAEGLSRLGSDTTRALFVHPGRAIQISRPFMSAQDFAEIEPFLPALSDTVVSVMVNHSDDAFHFSSRVTGIPKVAGLVTQLIEQKQREQQANAQLQRAISQDQWSEALAVVDDLLGKEAGSADLLRKKFHILAVGLKDRNSALACGEELFKKTQGNAKSLNNFAWALLTEGQYEGEYSELALQFSERCNELTKLGTWQYVDTLALAAFETGDAERAVTLEKKAIELSGGSSAAELQAALARFEKGIRPDRAADDTR